MSGTVRNSLWSWRLALSHLRRRLCWFQTAIVTMKEGLWIFWNYSRLEAGLGAMRHREVAFGTWRIISVDEFVDVVTDLGVVAATESV